MKIKDILVLVLLEHQRKQYPESTLHINKIRVASRDRLVTNRLGPGNFLKPFFYSCTQYMWMFALCLKILNAN